MLELKLAKLIKRIITDNKLSIPLENSLATKYFQVLKKSFFKNSAYISSNADFELLYSMCDKYNIQLSHFNEHEQKFYLEDKNGIKFVTDKYYWIVFEIFCAEIYKAVNYYYTFEDYIVVDVGMNRAYSTLYLAQNKNCKHVFGFEPCKSTYDLAKENIALNPNLSNKISTFNYGISKEDCNLEISTILNRDWASTFVEELKNDYWKNLKPEDFIKESIQLKNASAVLNDINLRNFKGKKILKMDIEGAEYDVLDNLIENDYLNDFDMIIGEVHLGFSKFAKKMANFKCVHKVKSTNNIYNICFIKEEVIK